jgi:hypothetical protein
MSPDKEMERQINDVKEFVAEICHGDTQHLAAADVVVVQEALVCYAEALRDWAAMKLPTPIMRKIRDRLADANRLHAWREFPAIVAELRAQDKQ